MPLISIILLGMAVSVDGFGVGFAYGLRKVHIPLTSIIIVCLSSSASIFVSMLAGSIVSDLFSKELASILGGIMLIGVGLLIVRQAIVSRWVSDSCESTQEKGFFLLSGVLREPSMADLDHSGVISAGEAVVLGVALALDAFGTGFGAAMMGFTPLSVSLTVGIAKFLLLSCGLFLGKQYSQKVEGKKAVVAAGVVLMVLGITHVLS